MNNFDRFVDKNSIMRIVLILFTIHCSLFTAIAQDTPNARQAKRIFTTAYNHFYGQEGVRFTYKINILGLYKEEGTAWNKGDKAKSIYKNTRMWNNGKEKYILREKKGIVELHDPLVNKKDEKLQMFKFEPDNYTYAVAKDPDGSDALLVTLTAKPGVKSKMKKIQALLTQGNYYPKKLRIKVSIFWATITFADFQAGGIDDSIFEFPKSQYPNYKIVDER
jgi:outer membrane lipoprotein-sorting protein